MTEPAAQPSKRVRCPVCYGKVDPDYPPHFCVDPTFDPSVECDCWRLTQPLCEADELPDHICPSTMRRTVAAWVERQEVATDAAAEMAHRKATEFAVRAEKAFHSEENSLSADYLRRLYFERDLGVSLHKGEIWPYPWDQLRIGMVVQERVEEDGSQTLANQLVADQRWIRALVLFASTFDEWKHYKAKYERYHHTLESDSSQHAWKDDEWIDTHYTEASAVVMDYFRRVGLPATPRTLRHFRACIAGVSQSDDTLPTRGLLITTYVPVNLDESGIVFNESSPVTSLDGALDLVVGPVLERAGVAIRRQRDWLRVVYSSPNPLGSLQSKRKAQKGAFTGNSVKQTYDSLDYLSEAVHGPCEDLRALIRSGAHVNEALGEYLDKVQRRVARRRQDAGVVVTPPARWRDHARLALRKRLFT